MSSYEPASSVNTDDIIRHLWSRKALLIILPSLLTIATYFVLRLGVQETFRTTAMLMIRTRPTDLREGVKFKEVDPPVYEEILTSDQLLFEVLTAGRERFPDSFNSYQFEKFRRAFSVDTTTTRDTSVTRVYAPIIALQIETAGRDEAKFLMDEWVRLAMERFGGLRAAESRSLQASIRERMLPLEAQAVESEMQLIVLAEESEQIRLALDQETPGTESRAAMVQERARIAGSIEEARQKLLVAREQLGQLRGVLATITPETVAPQDPLSENYVGDLILLSAPVTPEYRVAPQRTVIALAAGIAAGFMLILIFLGEFFLRRALLK